MRGMLQLPRVDESVPVPFGDKTNFPWLLFFWHSAWQLVVVEEYPGSWQDGTWVKAAHAKPIVVPLAQQVSCHGEFVRVARSFLRGMDRGEEACPEERQFRRTKLVELRQRARQPQIAKPAQPIDPPSPPAGQPVPLSDRENYPWLLWEYHRETQQVYLIELPGDWIEGRWVERGGVQSVRGSLVASGVESYREYCRIVCAYMRGRDRGQEACDAERTFRCLKIAEFQQREPGRFPLL